MYRALIAALAIMAGTACAGDIYRWTDDSGQVHYGSRPGGADAREIVVQERETSAASEKPDEVERRERSGQHVRQVKDAHALHDLPAHAASLLHNAPVL